MSAFVQYCNRKIADILSHGVFGDTPGDVCVLTNAVLKRYIWGSLRSHERSTDQRSTNLCAFVVRLLGFAGFSLELDPIPGQMVEQHQLEKAPDDYGLERPGSV